MVKKEKEKDHFNIDEEEMAKVGLHFGHKKSKLNPKMAPYLYGVRNGIHIIDLSKTKEYFEKALEFIKKLVSEDKVLLIIGTKVQSKALTKGFAKECGFPYVDERWLGGTFTNFDIIKKRIEYFKDLENKRASGELEKYTKKERLKIDKDLKDFERKFGGIKYLEKLPSAIFVLDMEKDVLAVKEAREKGITVIGITDSNINPNLADYPIPANDDAMSAVKYILEKVKEVTLKTKENMKDKKNQQEKVSESAEEMKEAKEKK